MIKQVAPRVGAWIETPLRYEFRGDEGVAPRVGAWIETEITKSISRTRIVSHPVWVRGLKLDAIEIIPCTDKSHPVWVRGLKPEIVANELAQMRVAPRVGAWIETVSPRCSGKTEVVAPRVGAWIETLVSSPSATSLSSRTPCGCVD